MKRRTTGLILFSVLGAGALIYLLAPNTGVPSSSIDGGDATQSSEGRGGDGYRVEGVVVDGLGTPIPDATVVVSERAATADDAGRFAFRGLAAGTHTVTASASGYICPGPEELAGLSVTLRGSRPEDKAVVGLRLVLSRPGRLQGRVVAAGKPVVAQLGLYYASARGLTERLPPFALEGVAYSGADGRFDLTDVAPGRLRIVAETEAQAFAESREVVLSDGELVSGITIDMVPGASVVGLVKGPDNSVIANAEIVISSDELPRNLRAKSAADGTFAVDRLAAGSVTLQVSAFGHRSETRPEIVVQPESETYVEIVLQPQQGLFGKVIRHDRRPAAGAYVVVQMGRKSRALRSDDQGRFQLQQAHVGHATAQAVDPRLQMSSSRSMVVGEETVLQMGPGGSAAGVVVDSKGAPLSQFTVAVKSFEATPPVPYSYRVYQPQQNTRSDGQFQFPSLRPGKFWFQARAPGLAPASSSAVVVTSGKLTSGVVIRLGTGAVVRGRVSSQDGAPVAGAELKLLDRDSPFRQQSTYSNQQGDYALTGVPQGRWSLHVSARTYRTQLASGVEVEEGAEVWRDITLVRGQTGQDFSFHGIGAVLKKHPNGLKIVQTIEGRPAELFGLSKGDTILEVDGEPVHDMSLSKVVEMIRGEQSTEVQIAVDRPGEGSLTIDVVRGEVVVEQQPKKKKRGRR